MGFVSEELNETEKLSIQRDKVDDMAVVYGKEASMWKVGHFTEERPATELNKPEIHTRRGLNQILKSWHSWRENLHRPLQPRRSSTPLTLQTFTYKQQFTEMPRSYLLVFICNVILVIISTALI